MENVCDSHTAEMSAMLIGLSPCFLVILEGNLGKKGFVSKINNIWFNLLNTLKVSIR